MIRARWAAIAASAAILAAALACGGGEPEPPQPQPSPQPAPQPARETTTLTYRILNEPDGSERIYYTPWEPGDDLMFAGDKAILRASPSSSAAEIATLPLGARVRIKEIGSESESLQSRANRWYRVASKEGEGYAFGSMLTPVVLRENLDGDPGPEVLSVSFKPSFEPRVRVMEPSFDQRDDRVAALDLPMSPGSRGGRVRAEVVPGQKTDWKLIHVELCDDDSCVSRLVAYLLAKPDSLGQLSSVEGRPEDVTFTREGFRLAGHSEPFTNVRGVLSSGPCKGCDQLVVKSYPKPKVLIDHQFPGERDVGPHLVCEALGRVREGRMQGKEVAGCKRDQQDPLHFVLQEDRWLQLGKDPTHVAGLVAERGITIEKGRAIDIRFEG